MEKGSSRSHGHASIISPDNRPTRVRWRIVVLLMAAAAINYLDRGCMGIAAPRIQEEFGLTTTQIGYVLGIFQYGYFLSYIFSGVLVDLFDVRVGYMVIMGFWSAVGMLTGAVFRLWQFLACRFLLGLAEAGCWPTNNKVVAEWFPREERPLACGMFDSGSSLAQVTGGPLLAFLVLHFGWRSSFAAAGSLGFVWILIWSVMFRHPGEHPKVNAAELAHIGSHRPEGRLTSKEAYARWKQLLRCPQIWGLVALGAADIPAWVVMFNWLPKYFYDARHIHFDRLGWYASSPMLGAIAGGTLGSSILGWVMRRPGITNTAARRRVFLMTIPLEWALIPALYVSDIHSIMLMFVAAFGLGLNTANLMSSYSDFVPLTMVATTSSIVTSSLLLYSLPFATYAGWIVQHFGYTTLFVFGAIISLCGFVVGFLLIPKFELIPTLQAFETSARTSA
jgi:ACS family hexuronate transporter-like MFS transporter